MFKDNVEVWEILASPWQFQSEGIKHEIRRSQAPLE